MRVLIHADSVVLWASARDTYNWAHRSGELWPCSTLSDNRVVVTFDTTGLVDLAVNGRDAGDIDSHELSALCADLIRTKLSRDHPMWNVIVGQFQSQCIM